MLRQSGVTTKQMQESPINAIFVWCNSDLTYPKQLASDINRADLKIVSPGWLEHASNWRGRKFSGIDTDHALDLTERQLDGLLAARTRVSVHNPKHNG
jgi:hypothetical protein